jgi:putative PEP-CTERM system TPR-repeat lipoprotein
MLNRNLVTATAVILALLSPAYAATDPKKAESYLTEGQKSLKKGDLRAAIIQFKNAVQNDPENAAARFELGVAQFAAGDAVSAEKELRLAREKGLDEAKVLPVLAQVYLRQGKDDQLLSEIPVGERAKEAESEIRLMRGYAFINKQRIDDAEASFQEALKRTDKPSRAQVGLARLRAAAGKLDEANGMVSQALAAEPKLLEGWMLTAQLRRAVDDQKGALDAYAKVLDIDPRNDAARLERANVLMALDRVDEADADVGAVLKTNGGNPMANYLNAMVLARRGQYKAAEGALQKLGPAATKYAPALYLAATISLAQQQYAQAEDNISRYLAMRPNEPGAVLILANSLIRRDNPKRALEVLKQASEAHPENLTLLTALAEAYGRNADPKNADAVLDQLVKVAPDDPALRTQLATQRLRLGQSEEALHDLESAIRKAPNSLEAGLLLVATHLQRNEVPAAEKAVDELAAKVPDNPVVHNLRGAVAMRKNDLAKAREAFGAALKLRADFAPAQMNLAQIEIAEKHPERAKALYDEILKRDATDQGALIAQADLAQSQNRPNEALLWLEKARNADAKAAVPRVRLVQAYVARKDMAKALEIAREAEKAAPSNPGVLDVLGQAQIAAGEALSAVTTYRRLTEVLPADAGAQVRLSEALAATGDKAGARRAVEKALQISTGNLPAQERYANLAVADGFLNEAIEFARGLVKSAPADNPVADLLLGDLLMRAGKPADADAAYAAGMKRKEDSLLVARRSGALVAAKQDAKAVSLLQDWLGRFPKDGQARFALASVYLDQKQVDPAIAEHERLYAENPNNVVVLNNLAWLYQQKNDDRAVTMGEKAYNAVPDSPAVADTYGWILMQRGDTQRALPLLQKASAQAPGQPQIGYHYAVALNKAGRKSEAAEVLKKSLGSKDAFDERAEAMTLMKQLSSGG